jgi:hypothetical protein
MYRPVPGFILKREVRLRIGLQHRFERLNVPTVGGLMERSVIPDRLLDIDVDPCVD